MHLKEIKINGKPLVKVSARDVDAAERQLWVTFPQGYREYITTLGEGVLGGSFVRIYPPRRILLELAEWRDRLRKHWFWDKSRKLLPQERALECIILGDTTNGDELVFHPGKPDCLFVLPADAETAYEAGKTLLDAVEWMCSSGKLTKRFKERNFEPFDSRKSKSSKAKETSVPAESLEETVSHLQKWADRVGLAKDIQRGFKEWLADWDEPLYGPLKQVVGKAKLKAVPKNQVLVFQPDKYSSPQVITTVTIIDDATGIHLGELQSFAEIDGSIQGAGESLTYSHAAALAEGWLGLTPP